MAILPILRMGHPVLWQTARSLDAAEIAGLAGLIADMDDTMRDAPGVGLAAPQIGQSIRLLVYRIPADRGAAQDTDAPGFDTTRALINPVLTPVAEEGREWGWEGCLSMPGLRGLVPRYKAVHFAGLGANGQPIAGVARGFHARILQHEVDHLDGVLYITHINDLSWLSYTEEIGHYADRPWPQEHP